MIQTAGFSQTSLHFSHPLSRKIADFPEEEGAVVLRTIGTGFNATRHHIKGSQSSHVCVSAELDHSVTSSRHRKLKQNVHKTFTALISRYPPPKLMVNYHVSFCDILQRKCLYVRSVRTVMPTVMCIMNSS